jgi:hypothetical protein
VIRKVVLLTWKKYYKYEKVRGFRVMSTTTAKYWTDTWREKPNIREMCGALPPHSGRYSATMRCVHTVNPKSADFLHAKTRLLYADVWQNLALIHGIFWHRFTLGENFLLKPLLRCGWLAKSVWMVGLSAHLGLTMFNRLLYGFDCIASSLWTPKVPIFALYNPYFMWGCLAKSGPYLRIDVG